MTTNTAVVGPGAVTAPPRGGRRAPNRVRRRRQFTAGLVMLAPLAVLLGALLGWPIIWTLLLSLTNEQLTGPTALHHQYIGLANFSALFHDPEFLSSLLHSLYYLVGSAYVGQVALGLGLAFLLRSCSRRVQAAVGGIIVMSWIIPEVIAAFMWFALLGKGGVVQQALHSVGIGYSSILVSEPLLALIVANSWRGVAFCMMLFTAALAAVPKEVVEAAIVDGASRFRCLIHVYIPFITGSILVAVVLVTLATLNDFTLIFALTGGGPGDSSQVLSTYMYQAGFTEYRIAYGTAVSVVMLLVGVILSVFYIRALRRK
jgi:multiple sugar transport system permease protein